MATVIRSVADLVNLSLGRMGYKGGMIGSIYEGSSAANAALVCYSQTRDEVMRGFEFGFTERSDNLVLLKQAPDGGYIPPTTWSNIYPPVPFRFTYAVPLDEIQIRTVKLAPLFLFNPDPQAQLWSLYNDTAPIVTNGVAGGPPQKVIVCNLENPICVYTGRVTDPSNWDAGFVESFAAALERRLAPVLMGAQGMEAAKMAAQDEALSGAKAERIQG